MRITAEELQRIVRESVKIVIAEAKKKKAKKKKQVDEDEKVALVQPKEYQAGRSLDMSKPLGKANLYKRQGASSVGPLTGESVIKSTIAKIIREEFSKKKVRR